MLRTAGRLATGQGTPAFDDGTRWVNWRPGGWPDQAALAGLNAVIHLAGENVASGEILVDLRGTRPESILGFVRQPLTYLPQSNDVVRVMTRGRPRRTAESRVLRVGAHLESFTQPLRVRGFDAAFERGLPVLLEYPESLGLQPGELVDLTPITRR